MRQFGVSLFIGLALLTGACNRADHEQAQRDLDKAKQDLKQAGSEAKKDFKEADRETEKALSDARAKIHQQLHEQHVTDHSKDTDQR